jgi:uncharacterized membrane protein YhaH (DUF805 family)
MEPVGHAGEKTMSTERPTSQTTGIIGRTLRLMLALLLGWMAYTVLRFETRANSVRALAIFAGLLAFYFILHLIIRRYGAGLHRWYGALLVVTPVILMFAMGGPLGRVAAAAYVGVSFLTQTLCADGSCEVLAVPVTILGRPTHLMGILFSPIDFIEKHLSGPGGLPG